MADTATSVSFVLDGHPQQAAPSETLLDVTRRLGSPVPHLCWSLAQGAAGNCRACMVEIEGERVLAPACCRSPREGMVVSTQSARAQRAQRMVLELLASDMPQRVFEPATAAPNELQHWLSAWQVPRGRLPARPPEHTPPEDRSHPAMHVQLDACIQCTRCVRACQDEQMHGVIGLAFRGEQARIVFDQGQAMGASSCVGCGECVQACPTGALLPAALAKPVAAVRAVDTLCPYCGVGCQLTVHTATAPAGASALTAGPDGKNASEHIVHITGRDGPANHGRLCVKGRFGFDYTRHEERLLVPLVRREGAAKDPGLIGNRPAVRAQFREATWEEALARAGGGLRDLRDAHGPQALAGFGSAKGSNEEAYLFQKLVRLGFGSNNVDHCTRLCHASSVAALLEGIGSGAVSNPVADVAQAACVIVIGANPTVNHPVAATWIKNAVAAGTQLVLADPRRNDLARHARHVLQFRPDTDVPLLQALAHTIVEEGLVNSRFIAERTEGWEAFVASLEGCSAEAMAPVCGVPAEELRAVARLYATSPASMIFWGMGISQHVHGTDNARCLIALALMTGQIGRPGTGLHPLRGQNNVQGASDAGLIPMMLPDYQRVSDAAARQRFAAAWGVPVERLSALPGLTVLEVMHAAAARQVRGMFILGENPAMSDPDLAHARHALAALDTLVVQDLFLTETAALADVVLPASSFFEKTGSFTNTDRTVQMGRRALPLPGQARQDLWCITELARALGLDWSHYGATPEDCDAAAAAVFEEMRQRMPALHGMRWARLAAEDAITSPCTQEGAAGERVLFTEYFPTASGRGRFVPVQFVPAAELPDEQYPLVLITGRVLEHWHTGSMTRRSAALDALEPEAVAHVHPQDLARFGVLAGEAVTLQTRRGQVVLRARADEHTPPGAVFTAFCWVEAAANLLTHAALDPVAKIPEFKFCAVRIHAGGEWTGTERA
jgi:formate dehydrogenase major subunit